MAEQDVDTAVATAEGEAERGEQTVTVADIGPALKSLSIEVPADRINKKIEASYSKLRTDASVPGFRRGHTPRKLLEKRFGTAVRDDVKGELLNECYTQAISDEKISVIGQPDIKDADTIELPDEGNLTFNVEVEVQPEIKLPDLDGIEVKRVQEPVSDDQVDEQIEMFRRRFGKMTQPPDGKVQPEDLVEADVRILTGKDAGDDAEVIEHLPNIRILVPTKANDGRGQVAGILIEDLAKQFKGRSTGDLLTISQTGPAGHESEKIRDQPLTLKIQIEQLHRNEPLDLEALPAQLAVQTVDQLKEQIRQMLQEQNQRRQVAGMHQQICDYLLDNVEVTLPERLSQRQAERWVRREALELAYRGMPEAQVEQRVAEMRSGRQDEASRELKQFFILSQATRELNVEVSEAEINGRVAMLASQQGRRPEKVRQHMQRSGELEHLFVQMTEQKTLDQILQKAKIIEVDAPDEKPESKNAPASKSKSPSESTGEAKTSTRTKKTKTTKKTKSKKSKSSQED